MSGHKILVELDQETERIVREIAEHDEVSMSVAATELFCDYIKKLGLLLPTIKAAADSVATVYISGPISNDPDYKEKFHAAQELLEECGYNVVNPAELVKVSPERDYTDYLSEAVWHMLQADELYMLKGWSQSTEAKLELKLAKRLGKLVRFQ